jgi:hypothetical protein
MRAAASSHCAPLFALLFVTSCVEAEAVRIARGDVFTTTSTGKRVEQHATTTAVYLDGGPHGKTPALPPGDYFFQVTDASGTNLMSLDHVSCRRFRVGDDGVIVNAYRGTNYTRENWQWTATECQHATGVDQEYATLSAITVRLAPFTEAAKGEYKVWVTSIGDYLGNPNMYPSVDDDVLPTAPGVFGFHATKSRVETFRVRVRQ